jgi:hypothetical protein
VGGHQRRVLTSRENEDVLQKSEAEVRVQVASGAWHQEEDVG